jgi:hypothetical protein
MGVDVGSELELLWRPSLKYLQHFRSRGKVCEYHKHLKPGPPSSCHSLDPHVPREPIQGLGLHWDVLKDTNVFLIYLCRRIQFVAIGRHQRKFDDRHSQQRLQRNYPPVQSTVNDFELEAPIRDKVGG